MAYYQHHQSFRTIKVDRITPMRIRAPRLAAHTGLNFLDAFSSAMRRLSSANFSLRSMSSATLHNTFMKGQHTWSAL